MTPAIPNDFLKQRAVLPREQSAIAAALGPAQANAAIPKGKSFRILAALKFDNGRQTASEVVIALGDNKEPYHVLSWQDDVATGQGSRKLASGWRS